MIEVDDGRAGWIREPLDAEDQTRRVRSAEDLEELVAGRRSLGVS